MANSPSEIKVGSLDHPGQDGISITAGYLPRFASGHLLFVREGHILAPNTLKVSGDPQSLGEAGNFSVAPKLAEIQYLQTTITEEQREEFGRLVGDTIQRIESAQFLPHSGIRFPQNPCSSCPYVGLCLGKQEMSDARLVRRPGAESLDWLDELAY